MLRQRAAEVMKKKQEDARRKEQQRIAELAQLIAKVNALGGLWLSEKEVDEGINRAKEGARGAGKGKIMDALKAQISYRKKVYCQKISDKKLWNFSENGRGYTVDEMAVRLKRIISDLNGTA